MLDRTKLRADLLELPVKDPQVAIQGGDRELVITIESDGFQGMNEAQRQALVSEHLASRYDDKELAAIEFVFINVPGEDTSDID